VTVEDPPVGIVGLLLAAGSGRRYGSPKALVDTGDGPWVLRALASLSDCASVVVVTGAGGADVAKLLPENVIVVENPDYESGVASSLRAGLATVPDEATAVVVALVDLPDVTAAVTRRVLARVAQADATLVLARATFSGRPGHPVVIGRSQIPGVLASLADPDAGAGRYLANHDVIGVECGDLATGVDRDTPSEDRHR
jgi:CTP:molybdopterin cytidylyltransferase MocA